MPQDGHRSSELPKRCCSFSQFAEPNKTQGSPRWKSPVKVKNCCS